jgi:hypothetical protein
VSGVRDSSGSPDLAGRRRAVSDGHALARPPAGCGVKWVADRRVPVKVPATLAGSASWERYSLISLAPAPGRPDPRVARFAAGWSMTGPVPQRVSFDPVPEGPSNARLTCCKIRFKIGRQSR